MAAMASRGVLLSFASRSCEAGYNDMTIRIYFDFSTPLDDPDDELDYVVGFHGRIFDSGSDEDDRETKEALIGRISGYRVYMDLVWDHRRSPMDVFDAHSQTLLEFYEVLFDHRTRELKESIGDISIGSDILIIDKVEILPDYRGKSIGLKAVRRTMEFLGSGCAVTALHPHPIQYDGKLDKDWTQRMQPQAFACDKRTAKKKLREYWSRLGFQRIGRTSYMAFAMTNRIHDV